MINSLISIIVPCYNQAEFLEESLTSVLQQTYTTWECIIVNDGSPDNTAEVANRWLLIDKRFRYVYQENGGLSKARNKGIAHAEGEFLLPLDADDMISPDYVELALREFARDNFLTVVYSKANLFGTVSGEWLIEDFTIRKLAEKNIIFCSAVYKKKDWERVGGYDENMTFGYEDWELWIAILKGGGKVKRIDRVGFFYRIRQNSLVHQLDEEKIDKIHSYLSVKHADFFVEQFGSFHSLYERNIKIQKHFNYKLRSEKFALDLFLKRFFGVTFFGKID